MLNAECHILKCAQVKLFCVFVCGQNVLLVTRVRVVEDCARDRFWSMCLRRVPGSVGPSGQAEGQDKWNFSI